MKRKILNFNCGLSLMPVLHPAAKLNLGRILPVYEQERRILFLTSTSKSSQKLLKSSIYQMTINLCDIFVGIGIGHCHVR